MNRKPLVPEAIAGALRGGGRVCDAGGGATQAVPHVPASHTVSPTCCPSLRLAVCQQPFATIYECLAMRLHMRMRGPQNSVEVCR